MEVSAGVDGSLVNDEPVIVEAVTFPPLLLHCHGPWLVQVELVVAIEALHSVGSKCIISAYYTYEKGASGRVLALFSKLLFADLNDFRLSRTTCRNHSSVLL